MANRQRRRRQERRRQHAERRTRRSLISGAGVTAGAVLGVASPALADTFYVNRGGDAGDGICDTTCTLRDATEGANDNSNGSSIFFQSNLTGTTITLTGGVITLFYPTYIYGRSTLSDDVTISGGATQRIFYLNQFDNGGDVTLYGLTLANGTAAGNGGAILDANADLSVIGSVLTGNLASGDGGAIYEQGISNYGRNLVIRDSTLSGNTAGDDGGAIYSVFNFGRIVESTVSGNTAGSTGTGSGGGIASNTGNSYSGGYTFDATISGNNADDGGGLSARDVYAYNTIVANNIAPAHGDLYIANDFYGATSLIEDPGGLTINGPSNITGVDPQLLVIDDNGGDTPTLKPAATSPVIDKGDSGFGSDQRGFPRPVDNPNVANVADGSDIGSVELSLAEGPQAPPSGPPSTPTTNPIPTSPAPGPAFNLKAAIKKCKKKFPPGPRRKKCIKKAKRRASTAARPADDATKARGLQARVFDHGWADHAWRSP
jgi:fibronectin-binding autotransporter adhesin